MPNISLPLDDIKDRYDVVVIGSGYGGGIAASRLARAGRQVCLLERGREIRPGEYPDTEAEVLCETQVNSPDGRAGSPAGMIDFHVNEQQNVLVGCGLGGTSLINANVSLEPEPEVFADPRWPAGVREHKDTLLAEGFRLAKEMLKPNPYPDDAPTLKKLEAQKQSAEAMGKNFYRPPINVNFENLPDGLNHVGEEQEPCVGCGDCVTGCNYKAKNTTLMNYLPDAFNHGAEIFCQASVHHLEKDGDEWLVHYQPVDVGREKFDAPTLVVRADLVVVSAGTLGSTGILLRSAKRGLSMSPRLGEDFSGNGDQFGFAYNSDQEINGIGFGNHKPEGREPVGPCITGIIDMRTGDDWTSRMVVEEGSIPGGIAGLVPATMASAAKVEGRDTDRGLVDAIREGKRELESLVRGPYHGAMQNTQTYLVMSHDNGRDRICLDDKEAVRIDWPGVGEQENFVKASNNLFEATKALGGTYVKNPLWTRILNHSLITVHPLGGAIMAEDAAHGVVNHKGQVFSGKAGADAYDNLYVSDGAVIPTSLAVNPLFTISAVTERCMRILCDERDWSIDYGLPSRPQTERYQPKLGVQFTETMKGFLSTDSHNPESTDLAMYRDANAKGEAANSPLEFTLTITSDDLDELLDTPEHAARMVGTVVAPALSSDPLTVTDGTFNLFVKFPDQVDTKHMRYRMKLTAEDGRTWFFSGFKTIHDDPDVLDIWPDTSTLYITVYEGDDDTGAVFGNGILHIKPTDFAKQLTTMAVLNADSFKQRAEALYRFGSAFAGALWETYGGIAVPDSYFDPDAQPRKKRPLRTDAPEVHWFRTEDDVKLRLTRYRGGTKGPVMLVHGLGVGSNIFSTDTINANLTEYLYAHGYDVWLLDFRASILLEASSQQSTGDQVARYDYPAAIAEIRRLTGADTVQAVVHCWGATTFFMSMLAGRSTYAPSCARKSPATSWSPRRRP